MEDEGNKLAKSVLDYSMASAEMEMMQAYLKHGRPLEHLTEEELEAEFINSFEAWAADFDSNETYMRIPFVQSEYAIRKLPTPDDQVKHVMAKITGSIREMYADGETVDGLAMIDEYKTAVKNQH